MASVTFDNCQPVGSDALIPTLPSNDQLAIVHRRASQAPVTSPGIGGPSGDLVQTDRAMLEP